LNTVSSSNTSGHFSSNFNLSTDIKSVANLIAFRLDNFVGTLTVSNMKLEKGSVATDWCPNPDDKQDKIGYTPADDSKVVHTTDTSSWQKQKITNDDGGNKYSFTTANTTDLVAAIQALPLGYHTFYCQAGVQGNPSSQAVRGIAEITTAGAKPLGVGYLTDSTGAFWSFYVDSSGLQLKRSVDADSIDPSVIVKTTLTARDDVLNLDYGSYTISGPLPKNAPDLENTGINWGTLVVLKMLSGANKTLEYRDVKGNVLINILSGKPLTWSGWHVPNSKTMASKTDVTTAINTATANMVDSTKATNFTAGLQSGGVDVATAADLKSVEGQAWRLMTLPDVPAATGMHMLYKVDKSNNLLYIVLDGIYKSATSKDANGLLLADLSAIVKGISRVDVIGANTTSNFYYYDVDFAQSPYSGSVSFGYSGTKLMLKSPYDNAPMIETSNRIDLCIEYGSTIKYTDLV